jgi:hypothetical protein
MAAVAKLRTWFLRNLLEAAERELGAPAIAALPARVPVRLRSHLSLDRLRSSAALDAIPLDEGEEALVAFDQTLGDGTGRLFERVACEMLARQLVQAAAAVRVGDLFGTVARLRGPIEHPFVDTPILFDLQRTPTGLTLTIGATGRPRATRLLGQLASAAIVAAERFARESHTDPLKVDTDMFADRARIEARFRRASSAPPPPLLDPAPVSRRSSGASRLSTNLSAEVARILDPSLSPDRLRAAPEEPISRRPPSGIPPAKDVLPPSRRTDRPAGEPPASTRPPSVPAARRDSAPAPPEDPNPPPARPASEPPPRRDSAPPSRGTSETPPTRRSDGS